MSRVQEDFISPLARVDAFMPALGDAADPPMSTPPKQPLKMARQAPLSWEYDELALDEFNPLAAE